MNADKYQRLAARTLIERPDFDITPEEEMLVWNALGLAGEAGEVADHIKKAVYHQQGIDREHLRKEIGDVCWYLAALCTKLDMSLGQVMQDNIMKLMARFPNGWDAGDSARKADEGVLGE